MRTHRANLTHPPPRCPRPWSGWVHLWSWTHPRYTSYSRSPVCSSKSLTVILDSDATVSFCTPTLVKRLNLVIHPNFQLDLLADQCFWVESKDEVNFLVAEQTTGEAFLRIWAPSHG